MFQCASCRTSSERGEKPVTVVLSRRLVVYAKGKTGHEIVREAKMHRGCAAEFEAKQP